MKVYHYTETANVDQILTKGLKPNTIDPSVLPRDGRDYVVRGLYPEDHIAQVNPEFFRKELSRFLGMELKHPFLFICALLEPEPREWLDLGLMSKLMNQRFFERNKTPVLLEVELFRTGGVFVRDAAINYAETENGSWQGYLDSRVDFEDYRGNFLAPELWIPYSISPRFIKEVPVPDSVQRDYESCRREQ